MTATCPYWSTGTLKRIAPPAGLRSITSVGMLRRQHLRAQSEDSMPVESDDGNEGLQEDTLAAKGTDSSSLPSRSAAPRSLRSMAPSR